MSTLTPTDFGQTQAYQALITAVYYGTTPATNETDDVPSNVFFSLLVKTDNGLVPIERAQTVSPVPADDTLRWGAYPSVYEGKIVTVLRDGNQVYPIIPWMPATIECDGAQPISRSNPLQPGNEGDTITPNTGGCGQ